MTMMVSNSFPKYWQLFTFLNVNSEATGFFQIRKQRRFFKTSTIRRYIRSSFMVDVFLQNVEKGRWLRVELLLFDLCTIRSNLSSCSSMLFDLDHSIALSRSFCKISVSVSLPILFKIRESSANSRRVDFFYA